MTFVHGKQSLDSRIIFQHQANIQRQISIVQMNHEVKDVLQNQISFRHNFRIKKFLGQQLAVKLHHVERHRHFRDEFDNLVAMKAVDVEVADAMVKQSCEIFGSSVVSRPIKNLPTPPTTFCAQVVDSFLS